MFSFYIILVISIQPFDSLAPWKKPVKTEHTKVEKKYAKVVDIEKLVC